jgi:hypothetical protein
MRELDLKSAAIEIWQALEQNKKQGLTTPFFFVVGAGISHPPLPLASQIQDLCKIEAQKFGKGESSLPASAPMIEQYSHWFEHAFPQPDNRQHFLRELMEKSHISRANFRLAHLLLDKTISHLAVTTNFDDFLSRALLLFGQRPIVCDHPKTLERIDLRSAELQIIHVHGSYWFYDCCNLMGEMNQRAAHSASNSVTMLSTLDGILREHSPWLSDTAVGRGRIYERSPAPPGNTAQDESLLVLLSEKRGPKFARMAYEQ